jgi:hypothetical protein
MTVKNQWDMHNIDNNERNEYGTLEPVTQERFPNQAVRLMTLNSELPPCDPATLIFVSLTSR